MFELASKEDEDNSPDNTEDEEEDDDDDEGEKEDGAHADSAHEKTDVSNPMDEVDDELVREIAAEDGVKLEDPAKKEFSSPEITIKVEPTEANADGEQEQETANVSEQPQEPSPSRRARRSAGRLGTGRGRGRGRGARRGGRGARQSPAAKREVKKEPGAEDDGAADEDGLMAGFQVIDEIGDAEEE